MKLKKLAQVIIVSCGFLALGACSTAGTGSHGYGSGASVSDANAEGVRASGIGDSENFGGNSGGRGAHNNRTYYFDYDSPIVHEDDKPAIFTNAHYLVTHTNARVIVEGHTDPRGSREYNVALGERRANAVADLLRSKGVRPGQIRVVSYGAERLAVPGHTEQDYQLDRRAIIVYQQK